MAYDQVHTSDDWHRHAHLSLLMVRLHADKGSARRVKLDDFLPRRRRASAERMSASDIQARMTALMTAQNQTTKGRRV